MTEQSLTLEEADATLGADETTRRMRHAAWRRGDLSWLLHNGTTDARKGQRAARALARNATGRMVLYDIARRWGKSFFFAVEACETCLQTPNARVPYACGTITSLREFIKPIFAQLIDTAPEDLRPEMVGDEVRFQNGSRIVFAACEDRNKAERLRGPKSHKIIVDEAGFIPILHYVVHSILLFQLAGTGGKMLIGSSPPDSPAHPFAELYKQADAEGAAMTATIHDTPYLTADDIAELCTACGGPETTTWKREGLAQFLVDPERALVPEFTAMHDSIVAEWQNVSPHVDRYIVGDLGYVDLAFILFAEWDFAGGMLVVVDEWSAARVETDTLQRAVDAKARALWGSAPIFRRTIDATARERADLVKLQGDDPTAENAWRAARNQERNAAVNQLRIATKYLSYRVHPRCVQLIRHMQHGTWNEHRTAFMREDGYGHFDGVAAMMYLERAADRTHNPAPPILADRYSQIVPHLATLPAGSDALRKYKIRQAFAGPRKT